MAIKIRGVEIPNIWAIESQPIAPKKYDTIHNTTQMSYSFLNVDCC
jgi:hypothetical protein